MTSTNKSAVEVSAGDCGSLTNIAPSRRPFPRAPTRRSQRPEIAHSWRRRWRRSPRHFVRPLTGRPARGHVLDPAGTRPPRARLLREESPVIYASGREKTGRLSSAGCCRPSADRHSALSPSVANELRRSPRRPDKMANNPGRAALPDRPDPPRGDGTPPRVSFLRRRSCSVSRRSARPRRGVQS